MVITFQSYVIYITHNVTMYETVEKSGEIMGMIDESMWIKTKEILKKGVNVMWYRKYL